MKGLIDRIIHAFRPPEQRLVVQRSDELKSQADSVRAESERMVDVVRQRTESGIWPQDMIRGTYRATNRTIRRDHP